MNPWWVVAGLVVFQAVLAIWHGLTCGRRR